VTTKNNPESSRAKVALAATLVLLPVLSFYAILFHLSLNIPVYDDYDAGLNYLNQSTQIPTLSGKLMYLLAAQQNEYKIVFGHAVIWLQYALFGNVDFRLTCALGNLFVLPLGWLLWKMFLPRETNLARRLALFIPVSLLLFQLTYSETLNWALPGLQNINVVFFSLAAIYFLVKPSRASFWSAIAMMVLAISASGNGFLVVPIGLLILTINRQYARIAGWLGATALCLAGYAYHYNAMSSQSPVHHSIVATILHMNPAYILVFAGAEFFRPLQVSLVAGIALLAYFAYLAKKGYWQKNPLVSYCILFLLFTAVGVAGIRSEFGLTSGTASRYRIYSDLLVIFAWFAFVEEFLKPQRDALRRNSRYLAAVAMATLLFLIGDVCGYHLLRHRDQDLVRGLALYEHPQPSGPAGPALAPADTPPWNAFAIRARVIMDRSIELHIYRPPNY
jgi:hypothetical protein